MMTVRSSGELIILRPSWLTLRKQLYWCDRKPWARNDSAEAGPVVERHSDGVAVCPATRIGGQGRCKVTRLALPFSSLIIVPRLRRRTEHGSALEPSAMRTAGTDNLEESRHKPRNTKAT